MQCVQITSVADASTWPLLAWLLAWLLAACAVRTPWLPAWPPALPAPVLAHAMMGHRHHCCLAGASAVLEAVQPYASLHAARVQVRVGAGAGAGAGGWEREDAGAAEGAGV